MLLLFIKNKIVILSYKATLEIDIKIIRNKL